MSYRLYHQGLFGWRDHLCCYWHHQFPQKMSLVMWNSVRSRPSCVGYSSYRMESLAVSLPRLRLRLTPITWQKTAQLYLLEVKQASQLPHLGWNSARSAYAGSGISGEPPRDPNQLSASTVIDYKWLRLAWVPVWSFFLLFYFSVPWSKILIEINNGQPIPLMWYIFILLFFLEY